MLTVVILLADIGLICKHAKLKTLVIGLANLQFQDMIKGISALKVNNAQLPMCSCRLEWWTICMLTILLTSVIGYLFLKCKQIHLIRGYQYSNTLHLMLCISDIYRYVPIKLGKLSGDVKFF